MKFNFKIQQFQDAVDAVVHIFNGQAYNDAKIQCGNFACRAFRHGGTSMCGNDLPVGLALQTLQALQGESHE